MQIAAHLLAVTAVSALAGCGADNGVADDPGGPVVITRVADGAIPYPTAQIKGRLTLREDCLMVDDAVAFWPAGTSWDRDQEAVNFGGDFRGAPPASIGAAFSGGGGVYEIGESDGALTSDGVAAIDDCVARTGAESVVLAYPSD